MNYRKFYVEQTKQKLPKDWEVHHINKDRDDNRIINLVALPKELHTKYHTLLERISKDYYYLRSFREFIFKVISIGVSQVAGYQRHIIEELNSNIYELEKIEKEIMVYIQIRNKQCNLTIQDELREVCQNGCN